jgi:hypothetical protein
MGPSVSAECGGKTAPRRVKFSKLLVSGKAGKRRIDLHFQESGREFTRFQKKKQRKNFGPGVAAGRKVN